MSDQRRGEITRTTRETDIRVSLGLDGGQVCDVTTGIPFLDHMLGAFAKHGYFDLRIVATGDLEIDAHHTMEDLGLVLGQALGQACGGKAGIERYGWAFVPMDEALVRVAVDLSGRPCLSYQLNPPSTTVGGVDVRLFREFFQALVNASGMALHIDMLHGDEAHHILEAAFKALGRALDRATRLDPRCTGIPSTKGVLA